MKNAVYLVLLLSACATPPVNHSQSRDEVEKVMALNRPLFETCFDREVKVNPKIYSGRVMLDWVIQKSGLPSDVKIWESSLNNNNIEQCLMGVLREARFSPQVEPMKVKYPFKFSDQPK